MDICQIVSHNVEMNKMVFYIVKVVWHVVSMGFCRAWPRGWVHAEVMKNSTPNMTVGLCSLTLTVCVLHATTIITN